MSISEQISLLEQNISKVIIGKQHSIELLLVCLLSDGHALLEDVPGLGKTVLARTLAKSISSRFKRVQCTPDLLPSDVTGVSIYNEKTREFEFKPGPVFANILLVDEINRTTPRTQSSLLEAMAETQVSADSKTYRLPSPFMVIATQNPIDNHGTYQLPEAQLDRFLMRISMGYPSLEDEITIMESQKTKEPLSAINAIIKAENVTKLQELTRAVHIEPNVMRYIASIVSATRKHQSLNFGASPRGSLALMRAAQALSLIKGQTFVDPKYVKQIAKPVLAHRISVKPQFLAKQSAELILDEILNTIEVPVTKLDTPIAANNTPNSNQEPPSRSPAQDIKSPAQAVKSTPQSGANNNVASSSQEKTNKLAETKNKETSDDPKTHNLDIFEFSE